MSAAKTIPFTVFVETHDTAALRSALEGMVQFWKAHHVSFAGELGKESFEYVEALRDSVMEAAEKALARPARNCDLYTTPGEAADAFDKMCRGHSIHCDRCPYELPNVVDGIHRCMARWLFATATLEKGEEGAS